MSTDLLTTHHKYTPEQVAARAARLLARSGWATGARLIVQEYDDARRGMAPFAREQVNLLAKVREVNQCRRPRGRPKSGTGFLSLEDIRTTRLYVTNYALFAQLLCRRAHRLGLVLTPTPAGWALSEAGPAASPRGSAPHLAAVAHVLHEAEGWTAPLTYFAAVCGLEHPV